MDQKISKTKPKSAIPLETKIAGKKTVQDWIDLRLKFLRGDSDVSLWKQAFDMLYERINTRFIKPIEQVLGMEEKKGEGHAAVALMCILIEFLEALFEGKVYEPPMTIEQINNLSEKLVVNPAVLERHTQPYTYSSSASLFQSFLTGQEPMKEYFDRPAAMKFYSDIRCGLLHEAATKNLSLIRDEKVNDVRCIAEVLNKALIIYRTPFYQLILTILKDYKYKLLNSSDLQQNFIRKMDDICQIERCYYFAYGSNLNTQRLREERQVQVHEIISKVRLDNWIFKYNKKSKKDPTTSKANIEYSPDAGNFTLGVCYVIDLDDFDRLHKNYEKTYSVKKVWIKSNEGQFIIAKTFVSESTWRESPKLPSKEYMDIIVAGAREHSFPEDYIAKHLDVNLS